MRNSAIYHFKLTRHVFQSAHINVRLELGAHLFVYFVLESVYFVHYYINRLISQLCRLKHFLHSARVVELVYAGKQVANIILNYTKILKIS